MMASPRCAERWRKSSCSAEPRLAATARRLVIHHPTPVMDAERLTLRLLPRTIGHQKAQQVGHLHTMLRFETLHTELLALLA
jgi:hypothetical protein